MEYRNVLTTCVYCGTGCGLYLQVLNGRIAGTLPVKEHPVSQGVLCIKGWNAHSFIYHEDRLKKPLIKRDGKFYEASWEEAYKIISEKFNATKREYGPDAIGVLSSAKCTNEENYVLQKFTRKVLGTNNIDHCARLCHSSTVVGLAASFGSGAMTNSIPDLEESSCILVTGSNTTEQHPIIGTRLIRAKESGAKLIVVDPRSIHLARFADIHVRQRPGSDVAWLNGVMHVIIREGLIDEKFISENTEGFEELKILIEKYTPERAEKISGIAADDIRSIARMYGSSGRSAIVYSMGITQHTTGVDNVKSCANLAMITGNIGKPGTGVNPLRGQNNVQGACDLGALVNVYPGYQKVTDPGAKTKFEKAWSAENLPDKPGLTVVELINGAGNGDIRAMYIMGENPVVTDPDKNHVVESMEKLPFLVVQDMFLTETAELADVVLPGCSFAEKDGTYTGTDRRVQLVQRAIGPIGESKPDWQIVSELAGFMGEEGFGFSSPEEIMEEIAAVTPQYGGISYTRLLSEGFLQWPCRSKDDNGTPFLHRDGKFTRGKGKIHAVEYQEPDEMPDESYPLVLTTGRNIFHWHSGSMSRRSKKLAGESPECYVEMNPDDAQKLNVSNGEMVKVLSRRGEIESRIFVTDRVTCGVVFIPFHFSEAAANVLTNPALDPLAKIPELKVSACRVEKI